MLNRLRLLDDGVVLFICTVATIVVAAAECWLLTFAWLEFARPVRSLHIAYTVLAVGSLIYLYRVRHRETTLTMHVVIAAVANLLIISLPPLIFLGLSNG